MITIIFVLIEADKLILYLSNLTDR